MTLRETLLGSAARRQVDQLLATALDQQSRRWHDWINSDLTHQALHPDGPDTITIKDIKED